MSIYAVSDQTFNYSNNLIDSKANNMLNPIRYTYLGIELILIYECVQNEHLIKTTHLQIMKEKSSYLMAFFRRRHLHIKTKKPYYIFAFLIKIYQQPICEHYGQTNS